MKEIEILAKLASTGTPPDRGSALRMSVGLEKTLNRFKDESLPFAAQGGAELRFVFAPYGRGKTHLLWALQEVSKTRGFVTAYIDCNSGQSPFSSPLQTYRMIANNMIPPEYNFDFSERMGVDVIIEESILSLDSHAVKQKDLSLCSAPGLASDFRNLVTAYSKILVSGLQRESLGLKIRSLLRADPSYPIRISDLYREAKWISRPIGKLVRRNAAAWVRSIASLPAVLGYQGLALFFDETEQTLSLQSMSAKNRLVHLANLRNFIDHLAIGSFQNCIIYYAVVEELIEFAKRELDALRQRLERVTFTEGHSLPNPRAAWVDLDELTFPTPEDKGFFRDLGNQILEIGLAAGLPENIREEIMKQFDALNIRYSTSIMGGAVREYVKAAASYVANGVTRYAR